jgi:hypothetical protein
MTITTYEGIVEKGRIRLKSGVRLPEKFKVYVIVPEFPARKRRTARVLTPRLRRRNQVADFKMKVSKA